MGSFASSHPVAKHLASTGESASVAKHTEETSGEKSTGCKIMSLMIVLYKSPSSHAGRQHLVEFVLGG